MQAYPFYLVNVFAESHFGGNHLAVFPHADGLTDVQMQAIAKQFNLSETVFIYPPTNKHGVSAVAVLRIFTPNYELPLAGHPTLGSAFILKNLYNLPSSFTINTQAKPVQIHIADDTVQMAVVGFEVHNITNHGSALHDICGLAPSHIVDTGYFANAGTLQFLLQVDSPSALHSAKINLDNLQQLFINHSCTNDYEPSIYLWAQDDNDDSVVYARMFAKEGDVISEDSGTGSACANLGAYFILQNQYPIAKTIHQGDDMGRPSRLTLTVDGEQTIFVGGRVVQVAKGEFLV